MDEASEVRLLEEANTHCFDQIGVCIVKKQKIGVPRHHGNMPPGNSFPQICVVSGSRIVDFGDIAQEYY
jgi:hypothetical protein